MGDLTEEEIKRIFKQDKKGLVICELLKRVNMGYWR